jgi:hypothetical protein
MTEKNIKRKEMIRLSSKIPSKLQNLMGEKKLETGLFIIIH